jgi:hypothetical protein
MQAPKRVNNFVQEETRERSNTQDRIPNQSSAKKSTGSTPAELESQARSGAEPLIWKPEDGNS